MRYVVTGAAWFVGSHLAGALGDAGRDGAGVDVGWQRRTEFEEELRAQWGWDSARVAAR